MLHHVELYVSDLTRSEAFWRPLLNALGYTEFQRWPRGVSYRLESTYLVFVQVEERHREPPFHRCRVGLNHLAFHVRTRAEVDRLTTALRAGGAPLLYADRHPHAGGPGSYVAFLEDPDRIKVELVADEPQAAFPDHFSAAADRYAAFRPRYPRDLFAVLADLCPRNEIAWDCAAGSGQASEDLAEHFHRVIATDASTQQIEQARPHPRIEYRVATAETSGLADHSVDLVTVAQALHWFRLEEFYAEARRVLRPGGLLAAWCYAVFRIDGAEIDAVVARFYDETVGHFWPPQRRWVDEGYRSLPFPSPELVLPPMSIDAELDLDAVLGYLGTWSAVQRYREARGEDPIPALAAELGPLWGAPQRRRSVRWPLHVRAVRF